MVVTGSEYGHNNARLALLKPSEVDKSGVLNIETPHKNMPENKFPRAAVFFVVAFGAPVLLSLLTGEEFNRGVQIGVVMGIIFAVMSLYFEPTFESSD
ncbi:hypothetical protein [Haladaptatus sp. NG-SE-30]